MIFSVDFVGVRVVVVGRRVVVGRIRAVFKGVQFHFLEVEPINLVFESDCYEVDDRYNPPAAEDKKKDGKNRANRIFFHDAFRKAIKIRGDCPKEICACYYYNLTYKKIDSPTYSVGLSIVKFAA